jgi:hypothetical protein
MMTEANASAPAQGEGLVMFFKKRRNETPRPGRVDEALARFQEGFN